jgi:hypothetical protein
MASRSAPPGIVSTMHRAGAEGLAGNQSCEPFAACGNAAMQKAEVTGGMISRKASRKHRL